VLKWLTASEERTHSTFGTVMFIFLTLQCRIHYAEKETRVPYKMEFTARHCTNDSGRMLMLKLEL